MEVPMATNRPREDQDLRISRTVIAVPARDLEKAFRFYRDGMGLRLAVETEGDEMPESVEFVIGDGVHLMIIPAGGFGWVAGGNSVAAKGVSECIISLGLETEAQVDGLIHEARAAGADIAREPRQQPWGYSATFKDLDGHVWMVSAPLTAQA
jgi:predicted lactoylglutathione lyase